MDCLLTRTQPPSWGRWTEGRIVCKHALHLHWSPACCNYLQGLNHKHSNQRHCTSYAEQDFLYFNFRNYRNPLSLSIMYPLIYRMVWALHRKTWNITQLQKCQNRKVACPAYAKRIFVVASENSSPGAMVKSRVCISSNISAPQLWDCLLTTLSNSNTGSSLFIQGIQDSDIGKLLHLPIFNCIETCIERCILSRILRSTFRFPLPLNCVLPRAKDGPAKGDSKTEMFSLACLGWR